MNLLFLSPTNLKEISFQTFLCFIFYNNNRLLLSIVIFQEIIINVHV